MRIGIDSLFLDGTQRSSLSNFVVAFVEAMVEHSTHRLVVFASPTTARFFGGLPPGSIDFVMCPVSNETRLSRILYQQALLPAAVAKHRVDVLCCLADVAPLRVKIPFVLKVNSLHHFTAPGSLGVARSAYRRLMIGESARRARFVVANSKPAARAIAKLLGVSDQRVRLVYEAVSTAFAPYEDQVRLASLLVDRYGISEKYLLFVSALYRYKNLDTLIEAFASLITSGQWRGNLIVAGPDPHGDKQRSADLATRLSVGRQVKFLGPVDNLDLRELYCGASALVYPSASETFGKPIVEAMRCGTPIIAADRGSIPDIAAGAAVLVNPDDPNAIAAAVVQLLDDRDLRNRLRAIGLKRGLDFSWHNVAVGFTRVLEEAAA